MTPPKELPEMEATPEPATSRRLIGRIFLLIIVLLLLVIAFHFLPVKQWIASFQSYVRGAGVIGYVIYAVVYALCCIIPTGAATLLTAAAGAIFGVLGGTAVVLVGATLGAIGAFLLGRTVLRRRIEASTSSNPKFVALDRAIAREGGKIVFLVRLSPIFPFTYVNYAFGLTGVRTMTYIVATFFGIVPGTFAFVYFGQAAASVATGTANHVTLAIGILATIVVTIFVARIAREAIRKAGVESD